MKFYKYTLFVMVILFIVGNTGCSPKTIDKDAANNENQIAASTIKENNDVSKDVSNQNDLPETNQDIYNMIIGQYIDAIVNDYYRDILEGKSTEWELIGTDINLNLLYSLLESASFKVYYALEDIDNNGIPELFIGGSEGDNIPKCYDMFIVNNSKMMNPFSELGYEFGHRTNLYLYSNGVLNVEWTNSGFNNGMDFYEISSDGINIELLESLSINHTTNGEIKYYHDSEGNIEIAEEDWLSILGNYRDAGATELEWIEISR